MSALKHYEPQRVLYYFEELTKIPHGSGNTKAISDYCVNFAKTHHLNYVQDEVNNVVIYKPGTRGYESSTPVILQGHLDMVCEKTLESNHDFMKDALDLAVEHGALYAKNTTLGGDDGIAIAYALAVLESQDIEHPPIEAVFTVDEETTMLGAEKLNTNLLKGKFLINIDSEEEGVLTCGCAGGVRQHITFNFVREQASGTKINILVKGLLGGHSGTDIHKQRGNATCLLARLYMNLSEQCSIHLLSIHGGDKDNVITYTAQMEILVNETNVEKVLSQIHYFSSTIKKEFGQDEPYVELEHTVELNALDDIIPSSIAQNIMQFIFLAPQGLMCFDRNLKGQSETSLNLGVTQTLTNTVHMQFLIRSSLETKKKLLSQQLSILAELLGAQAKVDSEYPAWTYNPNSELRQIMRECYIDLFDKAPRVESVHAGLECGIFLAHAPHLDPVSFGPNIFDIHSTNEKLDLNSVQRMWIFLLEVLKKCK